MSRVRHIQASGQTTFQAGQPEQAGDFVAMPGVLKEAVHKVQGKDTGHSVEHTEIPAPKVQGS